MTRIGMHKTGLVLGGFMGGWHVLWSALVLAGWAQPVIDFLFWLHFIRPVYVIEAFGLGRALLLVGLTFVVGYASGAGFGFLWNRLHR
jgi:hypothetical protein